MGKHKPMIGANGSLYTSKPAPEERCSSPMRVGVEVHPSRTPTPAEARMAALLQRVRAKQPTSA